jgi:WD40 repeat protein/DNA-binding SARP family transcriptional activator
VRFQLLGPLAASGDDGPIAVGGPKQRLVLAHLLLRSNTTVPIDQLIDAVWGEEPPETARATLQTYVSRLRGLLGSGRIEGEAPGYRLNAVPDELDTGRFETLLKEAREDGLDPTAAVDVLDEALELWRGPALADLGSEPSLFGEIARLEELRLVAVEERIAARLDLGQHADVVAELEAATAAHPMRERLWGQLILALYRSRRQADALAAFDRMRELLADQLGIDPSRELQDMNERVLRQDESLLLPGEPLRGYRLLERIGEGAFGAVYRAIQPHVKREVAVKSIHAELANQPDFVRRFEREAQLVARLEHPHIVPLYDYWREPDAAYLIMRFLRGGSLEDLLRDRPLEPEPAAKILDQVGAALAVAHQQGVVHRDVKPGNVLLDEEGNAYLSDFGIALETGAPEQTAGTMVRGTPAYLSPEQIKLEQTTPRSDIYALGIVLYEMLTGEHPFPGTSLNVLLDQHLHHPIPSVRDHRPDLPPAVDAAIARATAKDPQARFDDVLELCAGFRGAIGGAQVAVRGELRNPYKGLRAFLEADSADFFGRELLTRRLVERMAENGAARFLCVVGASGSGKSSVVRAGLVPAIRRGVIPDSESWYVVDLLPGAHPLRELETALLGVSVNPPPSLLDELERDERGLIRAVDRLLPDPTAELVIVVDQLEEIFTMVESDAERAHVLESLRAATADPKSRVRVVATLRADFFDQPLSVRGFGDLLASRNEAITPMSPEELERAIVGPAERVGLDVEPGLVAAMVADVIDRPSALPLLQYALTELAGREDVGALTLNAYRKVGGVSGALARRAEHLYDALNEGGRVACRQLFLRLVTLGEGTENTRRRVRRSELPHLDGRAMETVMDAFGRHRLLSFDRDPSTREPTIEIAHEALLRAWSRLRGWIDEAREDLRIRGGLATSAADWIVNDRDESFLLRGARLDSTAAWAETTTIALSTDDRTYLDESVRVREIDRAEEETRIARERALERRSVRRMRGLVAVLTAAALVAGTLTVLAVGQRGQALRQGRIATARELSAAALANLDVDPERSILLALQAVETTASDGPPLQEAEEALHSAIAADRLLFTIRDPSTINVAWSPDGRLLATGGSGGTAQHDAILWDSATGALVHRLSGHTGDITSVAFSPDGSRLVTTAEDARTIIWDARTGRRLTTVAAAGGNVGASFSPDGRLVAIGDTGEVAGITIVDAETGDLVRTLGRGGIDHCLPSFSPDGTSIVAACYDRNDSLFVYDVATGRRTLTIPATNGGAVYSPDGSRIVTACCDGSPRIWDPRTGRQLFALQGHTGEVFGVAWSADGTRLATSGTDGTARVWDATSGRQVMVLSGHAGGLGMVDLSPDGTRLLTGGGDGTARVWDITPAGGSEWIGGAEPFPIWNVEYGVDGSTILTAGEGARLWDSATGERVRSYPLTFGGTFGPGGSTVVSFVDTETGPAVQVLDADSGTEVHVIPVPWCCNLAVSPDGSVIATVLEAGGLALWDAASGTRLRRLRIAPVYPFVWVPDIAFSPDGSLIAAVAGDTLFAWDVTSGRKVLDIQAHSGLVSSVAFSRDGSRIATSGLDGAAVWDRTSGDRIVQLTGVGNIVNAAFSPDGRFLATAGDDGAARIWEVASGRQTLSLEDAGEGLTAVGFSPDGTKLATAGLDGILRVYVLPIDELVRLARERVTRGFTEQECRQYLHVVSCPPALARAPGAPPASGPPAAAESIGPEGAYLVTIRPGDLQLPVFSNQDVVDNAGEYTLSIGGDTWRLHQERPNGETIDTSGTYAVDGRQITFTDRYDLRCFGMSWSGRWALHRVELSFTTISSDTTPTCEPEALNEAIRRAVFGSHPWQRVNYHAVGG